MKLHKSILGTNRLRALLLGAVIFAGLDSRAQQAVPPAAPSAAPSAPPGAGNSLDEKTVLLSPFQVNASRDQGYQATSSLSGTRLNSKLEDLAASISVVTKQQLNDTAAVDLNDVFLYESNTEGTQQFTQFTIDRTFYNEDTTLNPQSANRIRGIGSANMASNNFAVSNSIPVDTYNVDAIEISRGPNGNIFGLGNAAGTVNLITGHANLSRDSSRVVSRFDDFGGWRDILDLNRVLWKGKLALRLAAVHDNKGFERQPAYEEINRLTAALGVRPFKNTVLHASYESYSNHFSRENTTLPRDSISEWLANGRPVWNPGFGANGGWRPLNGTAYTSVTSGNEGTQLPLGLLPGGTGFWANPSVYVDRDGSVGLYGMNAAGTGLTSPTTGTVFRYMETGNIYRRASDITKTPAVPLILFQPLSITDRSVYDNRSVNYLAPNLGRDGADTYSGILEQGIINTPRHRLALQLGYYREEINRYDHSVFSRSDSATPFVGIDVNEFLLDGSPNPYFLRPYMGGSQPNIKFTDEQNSDARATLAYQLDLSTGQGWRKWLGRHNLAAYGERRDLLTTSLAGRDVNVANYSWSSANDLGSLPLRGNTYRQYPRYYVGGPVTETGPVYDYAPADSFQLGTTPLSWFTSARTRVNEVADIREVIQSGNSKDREIRTAGVTWQAFFWKDSNGDDRIVPTFGWRFDRNRERASRNLNANLNATTTINPATHLHDLSFVHLFPTPWEEKSGTSHTAGVVVKVFPWLNLNYNQANSFKPEALAYDINANVLPNPTGRDKDYGLTFKLLDDRLVARLTRYETVEKNSRNGSITSAAVTRTLRLFFDPSSSNALTTATGTVFPNGSDAFDLEQSAAQWYLQANPTATAAAAQQYAVSNYLVPLGIDQVFIDRVRTLGASAFTDVNTVTSKGVEFEVTYNPSRYWTMKLAGAQQKAVDTELGNAVNDFIDSRLTAARAIIVPTTLTTAAGTGNGTAGLQWWRVGATSPTATGTNTPSGFYVGNVKAVVGLATANAGKPRAQTREYRFNFTTNYQLAGLFDHGWLKATSVGGAVRWESRAAVGYYGAAPSTDPEYNGAIIEYDADRPIYDKARAYVDFFASHDLKLWNDKVHCRVQLNVRNAFENGRLQPISYNPDGTAWNYRIIDPRQFILTFTFDL